MSRVRSLEKELHHLAQLRQQQQQQQVRPLGSATQPGAPTTIDAPSCPSSPSSACSSSSEAEAGALNGESRAAVRLHHESSSASSLLQHSSPNSTGSRFDLLMDGGRRCKRSEVRRAANGAHHKGGTGARERAKRTEPDNAGSAPHGAASAASPSSAPPAASSSPPVLLADPSVTPITIPSQPPFRRLQCQPFSHILVCDFEATCESGSVSYPHEIIEFPVVVLDTASLQVVAEFHSYVRPLKNPKLTKFCTELTGITQDMVDAADPLPVVVERFGAWLREMLYPLCRAWRLRHGNGGAAAAQDAEDVDGLAGGVCREDYCAALAANLRGEQRRFVYDDRTEASRATIAEEKMICFATDGPWDMRRFMHECSVLRDGVDFPPVCYRYINVRHSFCEHFKSRQMKLTHMLKKLHMSFEGQRHSGIADTRNIARVLAELFARGYRVHHVSTIKYTHRGSSFLAANAAAQELLAEYGEDDADNRAARTNRNNPRGGGSRKSLPRNKQQPKTARGHQKK